MPEQVPYEPRTVLQRAEQLDREIQRLLDDPRGEPFARAKTLRVCTQALAVLRGISGETLSEAAILKSHAWRSIEEVIMKTLGKWPDAEKAVAEALIGLA
jgi:hypothetical protein